MNTEAIQAGCETAFIDYRTNSNLAYRPQFVTNDHKQGKKILTSIEQELKQCDEFFISVAFITESGITPLLQTLKELEERGIPGKIMTTDYLTFSEPKALMKLASLKNIELKMYCVEEENVGFHTKGYMFKQEEVYRIIIGSANMTLSALTKNKEWNTKVVSTEQGEFAKEAIKEFNTLWGQARPLESWIDTYTEIYNEQKRITKATKLPTIAQARLEPNTMQVAFTNNLKKIIEEGGTRALLISATGTGKTYASAFALRSLKPKKVLFLVHREQIAKQALKSYQNVFGDTKKMGLLSGNSKEYDVDFLFSTVQMMSREDVYTRFEKEEFDIIVIDEVHRAGANTYNKVFQYFEPSFWLGMTASPERTDGFDIYQLFDHNIAYEIRLQHALQENLLCPFHYFGVTELVIDGQEIDDTTEFSYLISTDRVDHIIEKAEYFGYSGDRVKGLIFCSSTKEAAELSRLFNHKGYYTTALSGTDSQAVREEAIERLEQDEREGGLDYIFTVDIFNEGVDIPCVNQVIMLRPTESSIVFIQQLGRGLRKMEDKEYVVIIDFIGNYTKNFLIPIALSGDRSFNKDTIRKYVAEGNRVIPGSSTIHFDEVSRKRIYASIDSANFNDIKLIKDSYQDLKFKLGRIPKLLDFDEYGSIDVTRIFENKSLGSYHKFLDKYEKEYTVKLSESQEKYVEYISKKFASGKRVHELILLQRLITYKHNVMKLCKDTLEKEYGIQMKEKTVTNLANLMTNEFATGSNKKTYEDCIFIEKDKSDYKITESFSEMLKNDDFYQIVMELIEFGLHRNKKFYSNRYKDTSLQLYSKYTYEDVCRLLEWEKGEVALNIGGYKFDKATKTYPVFINYEKGEDISDSIAYEDRFLSETKLIAISKSGRTPESEDIVTAYHAKELGVDIELFVRKNKDDKMSKEFYYLGRMHTIGEPIPFIMEKANKKAVEIMYELETPVREDIYQYITQ
ncbi:MAG: DEAD/DEAH box helicase [bacterium]|nr:DEAD/DEAH box helicase [bacterium]